MKKKVAFENVDSNASSWTDNVDSQIIAKSKTKLNHHKLLLFGRTTNKLRQKNGEKPFVANGDGQSSVFSHVLRTWADDESVLRLSWSTALVIVFSLIASGIFYAIEVDSKCDWNYWRCLWMVNTIYTTIGYGTLRPCTGGGRMAVVIFALIGIPLNIVALADIGKLLARCLSFVWIRGFRKCLRKCRKRRDVVDVEKSTTKSHDTEEEISQIPLTFALLVAVFWICISATFFFLSESDHMSYADALYFVMISVTTIGLGDETPEKHYLVIVQFFFIIIGISIFSMVISIIQDKVEVLSNSVERLIGQEYAKTQTEGGELITDENQAREHVREIIKRQKGGALMKLLMGKNTENRLVADYMEKSRKHLVGTQTDNEMTDREVMAVADTSHVSVQADHGSSAVTRNRSTQLDWMPKIWKEFDWKKVKHASNEKQKTSPYAVRVAKRPSRSSSVDAKI